MAGLLRLHSVRYQEPHRLIRLNTMLAVSSMKAWHSADAASPSA
jgi:hypothetical protein